MNKEFEEIYQAKGEIIDGRLYVDIPKTKLLPSYTYYLLEYFNCDSITFGASTSWYNKEDLKGKEEWKDVKKYK